MPTGNPLLGTPFATADEEAVISGLLLTLRDDPVLSVGCRVYAPEGDPDTDLERQGNQPNVPADIAGTKYQLPIIRVEFGNYSAAWRGNAEHEGRLSINLHLYTPKFHWADRFRLFGALRNALYPDPTSPRKPIVDGRIRQPPCVGEALTLGGAMPVVLGDDQQATRTTAVYLLVFELNT